MHCMYYRLLYVFRTTLQRIRQKMHISPLFLMGYIEQIYLFCWIQLNNLFLSTKEGSPFYHFQNSLYDTAPKIDPWTSHTRFGHSTTNSTRSVITLCVNIFVTICKVYLMTKKIVHSLLGRHPQKWHVNSPTIQ